MEQRLLNYVAQHVVWVWRKPSPCVLALGEDIRRAYNRPLWTGMLVFPCKYPELASQTAAYKELAEKVRLGLYTANAMGLTRAYQSYVFAGPCPGKLRWAMFEVGVVAGWFNRRALRYVQPPITACLPDFVRAARRAIV